MPRFRVIFFLITAIVVFSNYAFADLKTVADFYTDSNKLKASTRQKKMLLDKQKKLMELEMIMVSTLKEYEKRDPNKGGTEERAVALLRFTLRPAFSLAHKKSISSSDCDYAKQSVQSDDSMGRGDSPPLTIQAKEALEWISILCD
ncbi:MAG: hypothetical protein ACXVCL_01490 [Bdellovibrio sp.]